MVAHQLKADATAPPQPELLAQGLGDGDLPLLVMEQAADGAKPGLAKVLPGKANAVVGGWSCLGAVKEPDVHTPQPLPRLTITP